VPNHPQNIELKKSVVTSLKLFFTQFEGINREILHKSYILIYNVSKPPRLCGYRFIMPGQRNAAPPQLGCPGILLSLTGIIKEPVP
jgi:hypothetical protein